MDKLIIESSYSMTELERKVTNRIMPKDSIKSIDFVINKDEYITIVITEERFVQ